jgi:hypothetical protein
MSKVLPGHEQMRENALAFPGNIEASQVLPVRPVTVRGP